MAHNVGRFARLRELLDFARAPMMMNSPSASSRPDTPLRTLLCIVAVCAALFVACDDDDSPTAPENMLVFEGRLTFGGSVEHDFTPRKEGTTRMVLTDVAPVLIDATIFDPAGLALSFALGRRVSGECQPTAQLGIRQGDVQFFALVESVNYCVVLGDPGLFPEDAVVSYSMLVELP